MAAKKKKKPSGIEWVGGLVSLPGYVTGEGEPFRPETLLWISAEGAVLGTRVAKPGELLGSACEHLQHTIALRVPCRPATITGTRRARVHSSRSDRRMRTAASPASR